MTHPNDPSSEPATPAEDTGTPATEAENRAWVMDIDDKGVPWDLKLGEDGKPIEVIDAYLLDPVPVPANKRYPHGSFLGEVVRSKYSSGRSDNPLSPNFKSTQIKPVQMGPNLPWWKLNATNSAPEKPPGVIPGYEGSASPAGYDLVEPPLARQPMAGMPSPHEVNTVKASNRTSDTGGGTLGAVVSPKLVRSTHGGPGVTVTSHTPKVQTTHLSSIGDGTARDGRGQQLPPDTSKGR